MVRQARFLCVIVCLLAGGATAVLAQAPARPLYYERALTDADLDGRTLRELALMRNTIYARAGHTFRKKWLADYFTAQSWYKPLAKDDDTKVTVTDRANAKNIAEAEAAIGRQELERRRKEIVARAGTPKALPDDELELRLISARLGEWVAAPGEEAPAGERSPLEDPRLLDKLLTVKQLENMSRRDLRILRNTFYARHGRPFKSEVLQQYFGAMEWYQPDASYTDARLSSVDKKNIRLVKSVEMSLGGPLGEREHQEDEGWFSAS